MTTRSPHSYGYDEDDTLPSGPELHSKESVKSFLSAKIFKNRPALNHGSTALQNTRTAQLPIHGVVESSAFDRPYGSGNPRFGVQVSITGGNIKSKKTTFAERAAKIGREAFGSRSASAEPYRNSGHQPFPSQYTAVKDMSDIYHDGTHFSNSSSSLVSSHSYTRNMRETIASSIYDETETVNPVPPLNIVKKASEARTIAPPQLPPFDHSSKMPSLTSFHLESDEESDRPTRHSIDSNESTTTITRKNLEATNSHFSWTTYTETERSISLVPSRRETEVLTREPDSRFSWTTASTDTTYQQETPYPASPSASGSSIMSRRRPVPGKDVAIPKRHDSLRNIQKVRGAAQDKVLPGPPRPQQKGDRIEELMSRLESLELQKMNMAKLMRELEKVESASPIDVSERMRRENRKKMAEVRTRQDELQKELFEVGRLLSRARAKAEEADGRSGLWLRRVTD